MKNDPEENGTPLSDSTEVTENLVPVFFLEDGHGQDSGKRAGGRRDAGPPLCRGGTVPTDTAAAPPATTPRRGAPRGVPGPYTKWRFVKL